MKWIFFKKNKGFTLLEAVVVIVIIAILASMGIAQYQRAIIRARRSMAMSLAKEAAKALMFYYQTTGGYYPNSLQGNSQSSQSIDVDSDGTVDITIPLRVNYGPSRYYYVNYAGNVSNIRIYNNRGGTQLYVLTYYYLNNTWSINESGL